MAGAGLGRHWFCLAHPDAEGIPGCSRWSSASDTTGIRCPPKIGRTLAGVPERKVSGWILCHPLAGWNVSGGGARSGGVASLDPRLLPLFPPGTMPPPGTTPSGNNAPREQCPPGTMPLENNALGEQNPAGVRSPPAVTAGVRGWPRAGPPPPRRAVWRRDCPGRAPARSRCRLQGPASPAPASCAPSPVPPAGPCR